MSRNAVDDAWPRQNTGHDAVYIISFLAPVEIVYFFPPHTRCARKKIVFMLLSYI
jgi:hypothetical protein